MVIAGKIFRIGEDLELDSIAAKIKDFRTEESYPSEGEAISLTTEVRDLDMRDYGLLATFNKDEVIHLYRRGEVVPAVKTIRAPILFCKYKDSLLLTVVERKFRANAIAGQLGEVLLLPPGGVVEARISPETLQRFHEENPGGTKVIFFDDVDIPNVNKLSLYGSELMNSSLYGEYLKHGKIWYVVMTSKRKGFVVGLTRNAVVTIFSRVDEKDFLDYVMDEVFPLLT